MMVKIQAQLNDLEGAFFKNNFSSSQAFTKDVTFSSRLRVPVFDSAPSVGELGDVFCLSNGELYVCTQASPIVWTLVGSQS